VSHDALLVIRFVCVACSAVVPIHSNESEKKLWQEHIRACDANKLIVSVIIWFLVERAFQKCHECHLRIALWSCIFMYTSKRIENVSIRCRQICAKIKIILPKVGTTLKQKWWMICQNVTQRKCLPIKILKKWIYLLLRASIWLPLLIHRQLECRKKC